MVALGRTAAQAPGGGADKRAKTRGGQTPGRAASSLSTCSASSAASSAGSVWADGEGPPEQQQQPVEMTVAYFREGSGREVRTELRDEIVLRDAMEGRYWTAKEGEVFMGTFQVGVGGCGWRLLGLPRWLTAG